MAKKTKQEAPKTLEHVIVKGRCSACGRTGGELKIACPGYKTAGDIQAEQRAKAGKPQPGPTPHAATSKKSKRSK
jgi:hypothetical protein